MDSVATHHFWKLDATILSEIAIELGRSPEEIEALQRYFRRQSAGVNIHHTDQSILSGLRQRGSWMFQGIERDIALIASRDA